MKYCSICKQSFETISSCVKCKCIRYCSKDCQRKDWPYHKNYCESFSKFWASERDKFEKLGEPLSSKMLEYMLSANVNVNKVKRQHPGKTLVVNGSLDGFAGFGYDIKCIDECSDSLNASELAKIQEILQSIDQEIHLVVYKLHTDEQNYEMLHIVTLGSGE